MAVREDEEAEACITDHNFETDQIIRGLCGRQEGHTAEISTTWQAFGCVFAMAGSTEGAVHLKQAIQQLHESAGEALCRAGQGDGPNRTWAPGTAGL